MEVHPHGNCDANVRLSEAECGAVALALGRAWHGRNSHANRPRGCYFIPATDTFGFNDEESNTATQCTFIRQCYCYEHGVRCLASQAPTYALLPGVSPPPPPLAPPSLPASNASKKKGWSPQGAISYRCVCDVGNYRCGHDDQPCKRCPPHTRCETIDTHDDRTLATLQLWAGYWRLSNSTADIRRCKTVDIRSICVGGGSMGDDRSYCAHGFRGPLCELCTVRLNSSSRFHFDKARLACEECPPASVAVMRLMGVCAGVALCVLLAHCLLRSRARQSPLRRMLSRLRLFWDLFGLRTKAKTLFAFFQVVASIPSVYEVEFPSQFTRAFRILRWPDVLGMELLLPADCFPSYMSLLLTTCLWPFALAVVILIGYAAAEVLPMIGHRTPARTSRVGGARRVGVQVVLRSLPGVLLLLYACIPIASSRILRSFHCLDFGYDDAAGLHKWFMAADLSVDCDSPEYRDGIWPAAVWMLAVWPIGVPILFSALLLACRKAIIERRPTPLSTATMFLWKDYEPRCFYYEPLETLRRVTLTGFVLINTLGKSQERTIIAMLVCLLVLLAQTIIAPYHRDDDEWISAASHISLTVIFLGAMMIKLCTDTPDACRPFALDAASASWFFLIYYIAFLTICVVLILFTFLVAGNKRTTIRLKTSNTEPVLNLHAGHRWHLFLSHVWRSGQCDDRAEPAHPKRLAPLLTPLLPLVTHLLSAPLPGQGPGGGNQAAAGVRPPD